MDGFTTYGNTFEEAFDSLNKVLQRCEDHNLSLNNEKCFMLMQEGVVIGHHVSHKGIQVDLPKVEVIINIPTPIKQKDVRSFLDHVGYYRHFIKDYPNS